MDQREALSKMYSPSMRRPGKRHGGVMQIWITRACDQACFGCTQGSNLGGKPGMMSVAQFDLACRSLKDYFGTIGVFGGNPAMHPQFPEICDVLKSHFPREKCGLWCNNPMGYGSIMRETFNPARSNLNVHLSKEAFEEFKRDWPESLPFGEQKDSRHSPPYVALKDVVPDEGKRWELISNCDINRHWSAMIGVFRGELRGWFCEIAGAQAMLHQHDPNYPDTGRYIVSGEQVFDQWWQYPMQHYGDQVAKHCHDCGIPLNGYGELAQAQEGKEQVSVTHLSIYKPKRQGREVQLVKTLDELYQEGERLNKMVDYLGNANK